MSPRRMTPGQTWRMSCCRFLRYQRSSTFPGTLPVSPSLYPAPPVPAQPNRAPTIDSRFVLLRVVDERPKIHLFPSYTISPAQSYYDPTTSLVTSGIPDASECLSPGSPAAMDCYLAEDGDLLLGDSSGLPLLPLPLLPLPADDVPSPESAATCSTGASFRRPRQCRLTCLGRTPSM